MSQTIDGARLTLLLNDLRLPAIKQGWAAFAERADKEGWPAARFLASLAEYEVAERDRRRIERHLIEAKLLPGKTLDAFEFDAVPMVSKAHVMAICAGDSWIDKGANLILIGGPGGGKRIWPRLSAWRWSRTAGGCYSPEPPTWCRNSRSRVANSGSKPQSTGSIVSIC
jgi:DNA replication protein DnaC